MYLIYHVCDETLTMGRVIGKTNEIKVFGSKKTESLSKVPKIGQGYLCRGV